jgi:hypothetical protein
MPTERRLKMAVYKIKDAEGIGPAFAEKLWIQEAKKNESTSVLARQEIKNR